MTKACGRRLHRLICYLHTTNQYTLESFCGDNADALTLFVYADADFAGDTKSSKPTSGAYIALVAKNTFISLGAWSKKQAVVSHSSTESGIVSLEQALRGEALHLLTLRGHIVTMLHGKSNDRGKTEISR